MACAPLVTACGDDGGGSDTDDSGSSTTGTMTTTDTPSSSGSTSAPTTDPGSTTDAQTSSTGDPTDGTTGGDTDTEGDESSSGGGGVDCSALPAGPFVPNVQFMPFGGSEDIGFNGLGQLAGKSGNAIILVDSDGNETASYPDNVMTTYGLRFTAGGTLLAAHPQQGEIIAIEPDGSTSQFVTGIGGVNGLYPDLDGNVWTTDFSSVRRYDSDGTPTMIVSGGDGNGANGIVYDPDRGVAFFTNYGAGRIAKVEIGADGSPGAITPLATVNGALFDGLSLDVCGNLYAVDNGNARVYRLMLDENADAVGDITDIVDGNMQNIANAQFGRGDGFDETSLYASGGPGIVYRLDVGVAGAEIPLP